MGKRGKRRGGDRAPVDHARLIDGFGEMRGQTHYESFESKCGRCGRPFVFTAAAQKYVHERRGVPIKRASSAGYCSSCAAKRGGENRARDQFADLDRAVARAKAASDERPKDGARLLEYVVAKIRVLERSWSGRSAQRLLGDVRRARRLDPKLTSTSKWEARLREMIDAAGG